MPQSGMSGSVGAPGGNPRGDPIIHTVGSLVRKKGCVVIAGPPPEPRRIFDTAHLQYKYEVLCFVTTPEAAVEGARRLATDARPPKSVRAGSH
jgi:hypothetical protein